jgi:hypothetical protein
MNELGVFAGCPAARLRLITGKNEKYLEAAHYRLTPAGWAINVGVKVIGCG